MSPGTASGRDARAVSSQGANAYQPPAYAAANPPEFLIASAMPYIVRGDWVKKNQSSSYNAKMTEGNHFTGSHGKHSSRVQFGRLCQLRMVICKAE